MFMDRNFPRDSSLLSIILCDVCVPKNHPTLQNSTTKLTRLRKGNGTATQNTKNFLLCEHNVKRIRDETLKVDTNLS